MCAVSISKKWGFINSKGEEVIKTEYGEAFEFKNGIASVFVGERSNNDWEEPQGNYCLINKEGRRICEAKFKMIWNFSEGLAKVEITDTADSYSTKKGFINTKGEIVIPLVYDVADDFSEGLAAVGVKNQKGEKLFFEENYTYGYINTKGEESIKLQYSRASRFINGRAVVSIGKQRSGGFISINLEDNSIINHEDWPKYALIDKKGVLILNYDWRHLIPIDNNLFLAERSKFNGDGVIDINGSTIIPFNYTNLSYLGKNMFTANDGGSNTAKLQVFTLENKLLFETNKFAMPAPKYEFDLLHVRTNNLSKSGFVDIYGNWVIRDKYDMVWSFESTDYEDK